MRSAANAESQAIADHRRLQRNVDVYLHKTLGLDTKMEDAPQHNGQGGKALSALDVARETERRHEAPSILGPGRAVRRVLAAVYAAEAAAVCRQGFPDSQVHVSLPVLLVIR